MRVIKHSTQHQKQTVHLPIITNQRPNLQILYFLLPWNSIDLYSSVQANPVEHSFVQLIDHIVLQLDVLVSNHLDVCLQLVVQNASAEVWEGRIRVEIYKRNEVEENTGLV